MRNDADICICCHRRKEKYCEKRKDSYWIPKQMYCPNCGTLSVGYQREELTEFECGRCLTMFVRSYKNRRQDVLLITIPKGTVRLT